MALQQLRRGVLSLAPRCSRMICTTGNQQGATETETAIHDKLVDALEAKFVMVEDVSGGCGSMYKVAVVSGKFDGHKLVEQHKMVKHAIKDEVADMHGLMVETLTPAKWEKKMEES